MLSPQMCVKCLEPITPEELIGMDPARDVSQRFRLQPVEKVSTFPPTADDSRLLQDLQVLRHRRKRHIE
jgi:hypothetical protein